MSDGRLILSVDMDEWYHAGRWVNGQQAAAVPDMKALFQRIYGQDRPAGDFVQPTRDLLKLFKQYDVQTTWFILGEIAEWYPDLVREVADHGHEIACHGMHHVDMTVIGETAFAEQLDHALSILEDVTGVRPVGYRAPNLVYDAWATPLLEARGILYDSTVCPSRSISGKYADWADAPSQPYHPAYARIGEPGDAKLVELPVATAPLIKLPAGSGIALRMFGYQWTMTALRYHIRQGDTAMYFHPYELGQRPPLEGGSWLKRQLFLRHIGPWMLHSVERMLRHFDGRIITARMAAETVLAG